MDQRISEIVDATRNLPKDPGHALATFANRAIQICGDVNPNIDDAEFVIKFVTEFSTKFNIDVSFKSRASEPRRDFALRILRELDGDLKPRLIVDVTSREVNDAINEFLDNQDDSFGLARLNDDEKVKIHAKINHIDK